MLSSKLLARLFEPGPILFGTAIFLVLYILIIRYRRRLHKIPGPFLASISNIPRFLSIYRSDNHLWTEQLHREYGPVVRVGPNHVSIADPAALSSIYSSGSGFVKSEFYSMFDAKHGPHHFVPTNFSCRDEEVHREMVKPTLSAYSQASILRMEGLLDECISMFQKTINEQIAKDATGSVVMDLTENLHLFAFDIITNVTFSKSLGFVRTGSDVHGVIDAVEGRLKYNCFVGQWPVLHQYLLRSEWGSWCANWFPAFAKMNTSAKIVELTRREVKRQEEEKSEGYIDMLNIWRAKTTHGGRPMSDGELVGAAVANVLAGSHPTAGVVRDLIYYLLRHPDYEARVRREIEGREKTKGLNAIVTYHEASDLPFFQACLKETMRVHPGFGMNLERIVPKTGIEIAGYFLPPGTVVGANPWVIGRDREVFGDDADCFRPERWIEAWAKATDNEEGKARLHRMETSFFNFSMGNRGCIGRNLALTVVNKVVPQLLRDFDIELVDHDKKLEPQNLVFVNELGMECRLRRHTGK